MGNTAATRYYVYNAHGDVIQLTDSAGNVTKSYQYDAFGVEVNPDGTDTNPFRYATMYYDREIEVYYDLARYYNPVTGRFTQQDEWDYMDPNDPLSLNLYTYCYNSPIRYYDPNGNSIQDILQGFASSVDRSTFSGLANWFLNTITGYQYDYVYDSEYDYYLGRTIGDAFSIAIGLGGVFSGVSTIVKAVQAGAAVTVGTMGGAAVLAYAGVSIAVTAGVAEITIGGAMMATSISNFNGDLDKLDQLRMTTKQATEAAEKLGYKKTNQYSHGQPVYEKVSGDGPKYITPDVDGHNGGVWKGANSVKDLGSKATRSGTYNSSLGRIGD